MTENDGTPEPPEHDADQEPAQRESELVPGLQAILEAVGYAELAASYTPEEIAARRAARRRVHGDDPEQVAAQAEYDGNPRLQALLRDAAQSGTVKRNRRPSPVDASGSGAGRVRIVIRPEPAAPGFPPVIQESLGVNQFGWTPEHADDQPVGMERAFRTNPQLIAMIEELRQTDPESVSGIAIVEVPEGAYWCVEDWAGFQYVTWSIAPMFIDNGDGPQRVDIDTEDRTGQDSESDQSWFWTPEWQAGEQDATNDIAAGRVTRYPSAEDFLASIGFGPLKPEEAIIAVQAAIHAVEAHRFAEYDATGEPVPRPDPETLKARNDAVDDLIQGLLDDGEES